MHQQRSWHAEDHVRRARFYAVEASGATLTRPERAPKELSLRVSIVMPALNEEPNVGPAIAEATAAAERLFEDHEIIVVDDGSCDGTAAAVKRAAAQDPRVRVISHARNRGYGDAVRTGFLSSRLDLVFLTDADLQFDLMELERFLPYVGTVDVVAGYRIQRQDTWLRRLNAYGWNMLVRTFFYVPVRDIDCAFKLYDHRVLERIDIESVGAMVNTEVMVKLGRAGASVVEVGVHHRPRVAGRARGAHPRVIAKAMREFLQMRKRLRALDGSA
jgi:glycosyltransferase involved in cell wall biosynthesis